jgi:hypothetical protein
MRIELNGLKDQPDRAMVIEKTTASVVLPSTLR